MGNKNQNVRAVSFFLTVVGLSSAVLMAMDVIHFTLPAGLLVIALMLAGLWAQGGNN